VLNGHLFQVAFFLPEFSFLGSTGGRVRIFERPYRRDRSRHIVDRMELR
jgi:hypothetical protein